MKLLSIGFSALLTCVNLLLLFMFCSAYRTSLKTHKVTVGSSSSPDAELTVFFISDIHRRRIPKKLLTKVKAHFNSVDLVIIGGDVAEKGVSSQRVKRNIERLSQLGPIFYIWGNNDREIGEVIIREIVSRVNGVILDNKSVRIPFHPDWIISGADDPSSGKTNLQEAMIFNEEYTYRLVAVHNPSLFNKILEINDVDLLVAGHTHGGQIRFGPFGMQPKGTFKKKLERAELISNGFGTTLVPLRFGAPSETHLLTIAYARRSGADYYA